MLIIISDGADAMVFLTGVNQNHSGFEVEGSAQLNDMFRLDGAMSYANWQFDGDASGKYKSILILQQ